MVERSVVGNGQDLSGNRCLWTKIVCAIEGADIDPDETEEVLRAGWELRWLSKEAGGGRGTRRMGWEI